MNNLVFLVPHVASIFSLVLISYEEWITKMYRRTESVLFGNVTVGVGC